MRAKFSLFLIFSITLTACSDYALMDQNTAIEKKEWANKQKPEFSVVIKDSSIPYNFYLNLRNTMNYPFSAIFVLVHQQNPDKTKITYRIKTTLANREGLWVGKSAGAIFTHQSRFLKTYHFPDTGTYLFKVEHNMRRDPLPGINNIGLRIEPVLSEF